MKDPQKWRPTGISELEEAAWEVLRSWNNKVVIAGPGAGKTELLAQRACFLLQTGILRSGSRILAISFKRDAAKNLKDRVGQRCDTEDAARFDSFTFDAFAKGLLDRFYPALAGVESHNSLPEKVGRWERAWRATQATNPATPSGSELAQPGRTSGLEFTEGRPIFELQMGL